MKGGATPGTRPGVSAQNNIMIQPTKRGVLYTGYKCNLKCKFCYYKHLASEKKQWFPISHCTKKAQNLRIWYGNQFVDLTGGEPTIYPEILPLVNYCNSIGLLPSCITNARALSDKGLVKEFKEAGIHDFLVSLQGLGNVYDKLVGVDGASERQMIALDHLCSLGVPFRFNVVLLEETAEQLLDMLEIAKSKSVKIINLIMFNLFETWRTEDGIVDASGIDFKYSVMAPKIKEMIDLANTYGIEVNVRYFPFCQLKGYERYVYNWRQLPTDPHEWDFNSWYSDETVDPDLAWYNNKGSQISQEADGHLKCESCKGCSLECICDGFNDLYADKYSTSEMESYDGDAYITDPFFYLRGKDKQSCFYYIEPLSYKDYKRNVEVIPELSLPSIQGQYPINDEHIVLSPVHGPTAEIPLGYYERPFKISVSVKGPADQVGFSFGDCQDIYTNISEASSLSLEVDPLGEWSLLKDGELCEPVGRDLGKLCVRPASHFLGGFVSMKTRQSFVRVGSVSVEAGERKGVGVSVLVVCVGYSRRLAVLLKSLGRQVSRDFEVIVATQKGRDDSGWVVSSAREMWRLRIKNIEFPAGKQISKAEMINAMLRYSQGSRVLITDADIILHPGTIKYLLGKCWYNKHASVERCLLPVETTEKILLGELDPIEDYEKLLSTHSGKITKWGNIIRNYSEDPALGYFQWVKGDLARRIGYPSRFGAYSGSDDGFSLAVLSELEATKVVMLPHPPVLHLDHGRSNWRGLGGSKWL